MKPLLHIDRLTVEFPTKRGVVRAVNDVTLELTDGERLGLVGESGSGKSMTLLSVLGLVPHPGRVVSGRIFYKEIDLLSLKTKSLRSLRGKDISMIFQDPMTTLNPVFKIGEQIRESLHVHRIYPSSLFGFGARRRREAERRRVLELMEEVGIPSPEERYEAYPHEFSGGMLQRAMIAIGLACNPTVLLADEPTTALDVTVQAQIMALLDRVNRERRTAIILVTHDLSLASEFCTRLAVMYAGKIVEYGPVDDLVNHPRHPYTRGLLKAIPRLDPDRRPLKPIPGEIDMAALPKGCAFAPRCSDAEKRCWEEPPHSQTVNEHHWAACFSI